MNCPNCDSKGITKAGLRATRKGKKQRYFCNECGRTFYSTSESKTAPKKA